MEKAKILLLDLDPSSGSGSALQAILERCEHPPIQLHQEVIATPETDLSSTKLSSILSSFDPHLIFLILHAGQLKPFRMPLEALSRRRLEMPIVAIVTEGRSDDLIGLLRLGMADFIIPPLQAIDVLPRLWRLLEYKSPERGLMHSLKEQFGLKQMVGQSPNFLAELAKIPLVAKCDASVLISGETGTGKELCARAIHYLSLRAKRPFVPVSCGAIPADLIENELFGHKPGAFTSASTFQPGLIQEADGGTLFLDEIDCLSLPAQVKLLRLLQDREYRHLGSTRTRHADIRVVAASNIDLHQALSDGKFRPDLFYRLNIIPLVLPPLRERREDVPLLARHFLVRYVNDFKKPISDLTPEAMEKLTVFEWPGNVRELENVIARAVVFARGRCIESGDILLPDLGEHPSQESFRKAKCRAIEQFEKGYLQKLLLAYQGNISRAARAAQKNRRAFWELIRKYQIDVQGFKSNPA